MRWRFGHSTLVSVFSSLLVLSASGDDLGRTTVKVDPSPTFEVTPMVPPIATTHSPTAAETRAPQMMRDKRSRPRLSVPSRCPALPGFGDAAPCHAHLDSNQFVGACRVQ